MSRFVPSHKKPTKRIPIAIISLLFLFCLRVIYLVGFSGHLEISFFNIADLFSNKKHDCYISSFSVDGIGHQMEAKISCLATALVLNQNRATAGTWTYMHQPVTILEHDEDPQAMEDLFGFSKVVTDIFNADTMDTVHRDNFACRKRPDDMIKDFNKICPKSKRTSQKAVVFNSDSCWDFIYCQNKPLPDEWHSNVVPLLRRTILSGPSYVNSNGQHSDTFVPQKTQRILSRCFIVVHIRLGDAYHRRMKSEWIQSVWKNLLDAKDTMNQRMSGGNNKASTKDATKFHLAIHSDGSRDEVLELLNFSEESVFITDNYNRNKPGVVDDDTISQTLVSLYCRGEKHATVAAAIYDMITADIFISSDSSLSRFVSYLRLPNQDGPSLHPEPVDGRERMGTIMGWSFLRNSENDSRMQLCSNDKATVPKNQDPARCPHWRTADPSFWSSLFNFYFARM